MDEEIFRHVIEIARIKLTEEEFSLFIKQFDEIFELLERVKTVNFEGEAEERVENPLREDRATMFSRDLLDVFPKRKGRYLEVPRNL